jgi:DNA primase
MDAFKFLLPAVQRIPDKLERAAVANDLAGYLGVDPGLVLEQFKRAATDRRAPGLDLAPRPKPQMQIPEIERILLNALVASDDARQQVLPRLKVAMTTGFVSREIFDALRQMSATGPVSFTELDARLGDPARALLHEMVAADETRDDVEHLARAEACLRRLEENSSGVAGRISGLDGNNYEVFRPPARRIDELRARIKAAEREGKTEEAHQWFAELHRLEQEVKGE